MLLTELGLYAEVQDNIAVLDDNVYMKNGTWYRLADIVEDSPDITIKVDID